MSTRISLDIVDVPAPPSREERKQRQFDYLMDKAEYATDMFLSDTDNRCALECLRKIYKFLDKYPGGCPEHLQPIYEMVQPTIEQYGAEGIE